MNMNVTKLTYDDEATNYQYQYMIDDWFMYMYV